MPLKIVIPASVILQQKDGILRLEHPLTCSRCGNTPADYFESHRLKLRAGLEAQPPAWQALQTGLQLHSQDPSVRALLPVEFPRSPRNAYRRFKHTGQTFPVAESLAHIRRDHCRTGVTPAHPVCPCHRRICHSESAMVDSHECRGGARASWLVQPGDRPDESPPRPGSYRQLTSRSPAPGCRIPLYAAPEDLNQVALEIRVENERWAQECAVYYHFHIEEFEE